MIIYNPIYSCIEFDCQQYNCHKFTVRAEQLASIRFLAVQLSGIHRPDKRTTYRYMY
eukprot:COSAG02_NODE_5005_length_4726_cov_78.139615_2_plen_57_part_00